MLLVGGIDIIPGKPGGGRLVGGKAGGGMDILGNGTFGLNGSNYQKVNIGLSSNDLRVSVVRA